VQQADCCFRGILLGVCVCLTVCNLETSTVRLCRPHLVCCATKKKKKKEHLYWQWKESVIVPVHRKGDTTLYINNQGLSLMS
jgi:hypothetical protein